MASSSCHLMLGMSYVVSGQHPFQRSRVSLVAHFAGVRESVGDHIPDSLATIRSRKQVIPELCRHDLGDVLVLGNGLDLFDLQPREVNALLKCQHPMIPS